jgi:hypothetical protein
VESVLQGAFAREARGQQAAREDTPIALPQVEVAIRISLCRNVVCAFHFELLISLTEVQSLTNNNNENFFKGYRIV